MKTELLLLVSTVLLLLGDNPEILQAQETSAPRIRTNLEVYPKEIYYGDIFFNRLKIQNNTGETVWSPVLTTSKVDLIQNDTQVYRWWPSLTLTIEEDLLIRLFVDSRPNYTLEIFREVADQTTEYALLRPLWLPMPEFTDLKEARDIEVAVSSGTQQYQVEFSPFPKHPKEINLKSSDHVDMTCPITVKPRPQEDFNLLQEWFLELPNPKTSECWTEYAAFVHAFYARESPFLINGLSREEAGKKRNSSIFDFVKFYQSMKTRTPELLARIDRTNELAAKIIERSKEPDTTFSQNMVEFIQLRGFLVDMRYAENEEAEEAAFEKLIDFIEKANDKELWTDFMYDIGFESIMSKHDSVAYWEYRERFAERMQIKNLCRTFDDYDRIYGFRKKEKKQSE